MTSGELLDLDDRSRLRAISSIVTQYEENHVVLANKIRRTESWNKP